MGRVAKLHYGLEQITKNYREKNINFEEAKQLHLGACIESIADSLAWYMDRTEKMDRYDDEPVSVNKDTAEAIKEKLKKYAYSNYGMNQDICDAIVELPIEQWLDEVGNESIKKEE